MDLSHPLASVVPSLDAYVLEVLAGTETALGVSQIARLATRGSRKGVSAVLDRMVEHGLVIAEPANQGHLYRLNRRHVLTPAVLAAANARATVIELIAGAVGHLDPVHASIFGSFARGAAGVSSDIDVLVVAASDAKLDRWDDALRTLRADVLAATGNRAQIVGCTTARIWSLDAAAEPIVGEWLEDGLLLAGTPLRQVLLPARSGSRGRSAR